MDCPIPGRGGSPPLPSVILLTPSSQPLPIPFATRFPFLSPSSLLLLSSRRPSRLCCENMWRELGGEVGLNPPPSLTGVQGFKTRRPYLYTPFYFKCWQQNDKHQMTLLRVPIADFFLRLLGVVVVRCSPPPPPPPLPRRRLLAYLPFWLEKHSSLIYWERKLEKRSGGKVSFWKVPTA